MQKHRNDWEELSSMDACWSILSDSKYKHQKWDLEQFFATGEEEIARVMESAEAVWTPASTDSALDFGCGVGRLTRALAGRFHECTGVDISQKMINMATELNGDMPGCRFLLNTEEDLRIFDDATFDFVYTNIVLQHLPSRQMIENYIAEFIRVIRPGGIVVFQLPTHVSLAKLTRCGIRRTLYRAARRAGASEQLAFRYGLHPIRNSYIPENEVRGLISARGAHLLLAESGSLEKGVTSCTYYVAGQSAGQHTTQA